MKKVLLLKFVFILLAYCIAIEAVKAQWDNEVSMRFEIKMDFDSEKPLVTQNLHHSDFKSLDTISILDTIISKEGLSSICDHHGNIKLIANAGMLFDGAGNYLNLRMRQYLFYQTILFPTADTNTYVWLESKISFAWPKTKSTNPDWGWHSTEDSGLYLNVVRFIGPGKVSVSTKKIDTLLAMHFAAIDLGNLQFALVMRSGDYLISYRVSDTSLIELQRNYLPIADSLFGLNGSGCQLRFNHQINKLAELVYYHGTDPNRKDYVFLSTNLKTYEFDKNTGVIQYPAEIYEDKEVLANGKTILQGWGRTIRGTSIGFSPNGRYLYMTSWNNYSIDHEFDRPNNTMVRSILQFDLEQYKQSGWMQEIPFQAETYASFDNFIMGANAKCYLVSGHELFEIQKPNDKGNTCHLVRIQSSVNAFWPNNRRNSYGYGAFANYIQTIPNVNFKLSYDCISSYRLDNLSDTVVNKRFVWYVYDSASNLLDSSTSIHLAFNHPPGNYFVKLRGFNANGYGRWFSDSVFIPTYNRVQAGFVLNNQNVCLHTDVVFNDSSFFDLLHPNIGASYHYFFGDGSDSLVFTNKNITYNYTKTGVYFPYLVFSNGFCVDTFFHPKGIAVKPIPGKGISVANFSGCQPFLLVAKRNLYDSLTEKVFYSINGKSHELWGSNPTFYDTLHQPGTYKLVQQALGKNLCSTWDTAAIEVKQGLDTTKNIKWKSISVLNEEVLKLEWYPVLHSQKFQLFSNTKKDTVFRGAQNLAYDTVSNLSKAIYTYQLAAHDVCGRVITSEKANNVLLSGKNFGNDFAKLTWNNPNLWTQTGTYYQLNQTNNLGYELNNLFNSDMLEFLDYNFLQNDSINKCYRIKAYHVDSLYPSLSNVLCLPYDVVFYVPDAFSPNGDGLNDVFKVEGLGILPNNYRMEIYNRWGQLVFASDDINHNWDGGNEASGIYVYLIKIRGKQNNIEKQFNLKGNVTLLR